MAEQRKPWEQQDGESNESYSRFLLYRNLGPGRSLDAAYRLYCAIGEQAERAALEAGGDTKGRKGRAKSGVNPADAQRARAPGSWRRESEKYRWAERAVAWDVAKLDQYGETAVVDYIGSLQRVARILVETLSDGDFRPASWGELLDGIDFLSKHIAPEAPGALHKRGPRDLDQDGGSPGA